MLTQAILKSQVSYNLETGEFTRLVSNSTQVKVGDIAGYLRKDCYVEMNIKGKLYLAHRLAWLYVTGDFPEEMIDHVNGIKNDNRLTNLRAATQEQNQRNSKFYKNNTSGFKGVTWHKLIKKWVAQCSVNGKQHRLGNFHSAELASQAYQEFAKLHHKEFYKRV